MRTSGFWVAPEMGVPLRCQLRVGAGVPLTVALKITVLPEEIVWAAGEEMNLGAAVVPLIVSRAS